MGDSQQDTSKSQVGEEESGSISEASAGAARQGSMSGNSIHLIHPYRDGSVLVFDDSAVGLVREPFIEGADLILDLAARAAGADPDRFDLVFSEGPFPGYQASATWIEKGEMGFGDWYQVALSGLGVHNGWLCPALLKYFPSAPSQIFFRVQSTEKGEQ